MQTYMAEMEKSRGARSFAWTEQHWLARGIKRRLARFICRADRGRHLVMYDPSNMRWTIR
jgi:hypothetical protein